MNEVKALKMALRALNATMTTHGTKEAIDEARQEAAKACEEILDQPTFWMNCQTLADSIHYPKCWDIAAYPTLDDALDEMVAWFEISECSTCEEELAQPEREILGNVDYIPCCTDQTCPKCKPPQPKQDIPTMDDAIAAGDSVLMNEQAALLRECRSALDSLIQQKPQLAGLLCGSTTLGNLKASLYGYRPQGVFNPKKWQDLTDDEIYLCTNHIDRNLRGWANEYARSIEAKLKEKNFG